MARRHRWRGEATRGGAWSGRERARETRRGSEGARERGSEGGWPHLVDVDVRVVLGDALVGDVQLMRLLRVHRLRVLLGLVVVVGTPLVPVLLKEWQVRDDRPAPR